MGDCGSIPGSRRSSEEGIDLPLQYSWASMVVQKVKNLPVMQETWVWSLGWEDPLEEGMATHSSTLSWRIPMGRGAWRAIVHAVSNSQTCWATKYNTAHVLFWLNKKAGKWSLSIFWNSLTFLCCFFLKCLIGFTICEWHQSAFYF